MQMHYISFIQAKVCLGVGFIKNRQFQQKRILKRNV